MAAVRSEIVEMTEHWAAVLEEVVESHLQSNLPTCVDAHNDLSQDARLNQEHWGRNQ